MWTVQTPEDRGPSPAVGNVSRLRVRNAADKIKGQTQNRDQTDGCRDEQHRPDHKSHTSLREEDSPEDVGDGVEEAALRRL